MKNFTEFAEAMSELLFEMRLEDIGGSALYDSISNEIPETFINNILDKQVHIDIIKKRICDDILVTDSNKFWNKTKGIYEYTAPDTYDHSYLVDTYIQEVWEDTQTKWVYICTHCNSDNVQVKAWVRPNNGHKFVDEIEGDEMGWCCDEELVADIQTTEVKRSTKVIGFQVCGEDGTTEDGKIHPHMNSEKEVYNLEQAKSMLNDDNYKDEQWKLVVVWKGEIKNAVLMFTDDLR